VLELLEKELSVHGVSIHPGGIIEISGYDSLPVREAISVFRDKAKGSYGIVSKLWTDLASLLSESSHMNSKPPEGIENIFVYALQGLKRMMFLFPGLKDFDAIEKVLNESLNRDINHFSYKTMSKVIEYKLAIEWVSHLISRNLYISYLMREAHFQRRQKHKTQAAGFQGPGPSNLDMPMKERVFDWSEIDEEVRGRDADIRNQSRYRMGLEGYNDPYVNEGFVWRELKNEPFLWGKEGENPYPHRNALWS